MEQDVFVAWEDRYSVGITAIDDQHKELLVLTNKLYEACREGEDKARVYFKEVIHGAVEYVQFHFSSEEQLMERVGFPELPAHKVEHALFIKEVLDAVKNLENGKTFVPNAFVRFLRDWVLTHIAMSDFKYAEYIQGLRKQGTLQSFINMQALTQKGFQGVAR
ncbi:MAG: bacteriohemerythrin [Spirochaetaceae bacterium]|jgi:hemerythrin|nr:bacteriohemerythrin [Spirochaetaceae bacterium]